MPETLTQIVKDVKQCTLCYQHLPHGANPVIQVSSTAKILIAGQAPGLKVHQSGIPFDDKSGDRLREWLGVDKSTFYNDKVFAILPMAFCYPGKGKSGDLPPRPECAEKWRNKLLQQLTNIELIVAVGGYAQSWHLATKSQQTLTETVKQWRSYFDTSNPAVMPIPHPSPRNNIWLKKNPWFELEVVHELRQYTRKIISL